VTGPVFVTGGSGVIGSALVARLCKDGDEVVALARSDAAAAAVAAAGARPVRGDVLDEQGLARAMAGARLVFNVAGVNTLCPADRDVLYRTNVGGAEAVVRAAARAGVGRVVHTSSAAALGEAAGAVGREDSPHRGWFLSDYERSKHDGERAVLAAARDVGLDAVCVNPSSVQGPGRASGTGRILLGLLDGRLNVFLDTHVSLVDIADCVEGHLLAAERGRAGERYVLNGVTLTSREALALVGRVAGVERNPRMLPPWAARVAGAVAEGAFRLVRRPPPVCRQMVRTLLFGHRYDGTRATRELGLGYTPPEDTLRRTLRWAASKGLVRNVRVTRSSPG
jgi:dihydroflavonol-4-reductase